MVLALYFATGIPLLDVLGAPLFDAIGVSSVGIRYLLGAGEALGDCEANESIASNDNSVFLRCQ